MYNFLNKILSDKKGGIVFTCFGIWHWCYIILTFAIAFFLIKYLMNKNALYRKRILDWVINVVFALYVSDFFLMPIAFGDIDIENLPFHICTAMCVMCFVSRHNNKLSKYRTNFALLGLISNFVYLVYPAGVMWYSVHPLSYRVIETMLFHGIMTIYGMLTIIYDDQTLSFKTCYRDVVIIIGMTVWAILGNNIYNGINGDYTYKYNWFFVIRDPFDILPSEYSYIIMPFLNIFMFAVAEMIIFQIYKFSRRCLTHEQSKDHQ